jgi:hypothetical protein
MRQLQVIRGGSNCSADRFPRAKPPIPHYLFVLGQQYHEFDFRIMLYEWN